MNIRGVLNAAQKTIVKHGPDILTGLGTVGLIVSGLMAVNQTPKAIDILRAHEEELDLGEELTVKDKIKDCWMYYTPSIVLATLSVGSIIFARHIDSRRMAAWAAAYQMSEHALVRMKDAVKDELGDRKLKKIEDNADLKVMDEHPIDPANIFDTGNGNDLFCDYYSGRYFRSNPDSVKAVYNQFIAKLLREDSMSVNDWMSALSLPPLGTELGDEMGWTSSMYKNGALWEEPIFTYGPGYLDAPCAVVRLACKADVEYMYHY